MSSRAERLAISDFADAWPGVIESLSTRLKALVTALKAEGLSTTVIYHAPSAAVVVSPVPKSTPAKEAIQAGKLSLADASNLLLPDHPHDLERLWFDAEPTQPVKGDAPPLSAHVLGIADSEAAASAIARFVKAAGLRPTALIPAECISFAAAVDSAIERSTSSAKSAVTLFCGEHTSVLAAATAGRLRFVRRIGLGSEMLVEALAREIRIGDGAPLTLDRAAASELLFRCGIPVRGQAYDAQSGLTSDAVLPLVQPILQRTLIEIKQSLRFGLDESERGGAGVVGLGLGSHIGRLVQLFADQAGLKAEPIAPADGQPSSASRGLIHSLATGRQLQLRLLPSSLVAEFTTRRVKRGMYVGFAGAAAMVAMAAVNVRSELPKQNARVDQAQAALDSARPVMELNSKLVSAQAAVANARQRIAVRMSDSAPWDAVLAVLAKATPTGVRISEAQMSFDGHKPICRISGQTVPSQGDGNAVLRAYLDALSAVPIVQSTRLGATQRGETEQGTIQSFEMTVALVELPSNYSKAGSGMATVIPSEENSR